MKQLHANRLRKLIEGVRAGVRGIGWNFGVYRDNECCGTVACAAGHCPAIWPENWRWRDETPVLRNSADCWGAESQQRWFGLTEDEAAHLFMPGEQRKRFGWTYQLKEGSRRETWCRMAEAFLESKGFPATPTDSGFTPPAWFPSEFPDVLGLAEVEVGHGKVEACEGGVGPAVKTGGR